MGVDPQKQSILDGWPVYRLWWLMFLISVVPVVVIVLGIGILIPSFSGFVDLDSETLTLFRITMAFTLVAGVTSPVWAPKLNRFKRVLLRAPQSTERLTYALCGASVNLAAASYLVNGLWLDFFLILGGSILQFIVYYPRRAVPG